MNAQLNQKSVFQVKGRLKDSISNQPIEHAAPTLFLKGEKNSKWR